GGARAGTARGEHPDEGELRSAREHQQAQHAGLPDVEARGDREGAEGDPVGRHREPHPERRTHGRTALVRNSLRVAIRRAHRRSSGTPCTPLWWRSDGNTACTEKPTPGTRRASNTPPKSSARSRISVMPRPLAVCVRAAASSSIV